MKRYEQAKADYENLDSPHGADANDLTGGFVIDEITSKIYNSLRKENIVIPFPQRTLHIKKDT